jgi:hypothetical protein
MAERNWQPIKTARKDGTEVPVWVVLHEMGYMGEEDWSVRGVFATLAGAEACVAKAESFGSDDGYPSFLHIHESTLSLPTPPQAEGGE